MQKPPPPSKKNHPRPHRCGADWWATPVWAFFFRQGHMSADHMGAFALRWSALRWSALRWSCMCSKKGARECTTPVWSLMWSKSPIPPPTGPTPVWCTGVPPFCSAATMKMTMKMAASCQPRLHRKWPVPCSYGSRPGASRMSPIAHLFFLSVLRAESPHS